MEAVTEIAHGGEHSSLREIKPLFYQLHMNICVFFLHSRRNVEGATRSRRGMPRGYYPGSEGSPLVLWGSQSSSHQCMSGLGQENPNL